MFTFLTVSLEHREIDRNTTDVCAGVCVWGGVTGMCVCTVGQGAAGPLSIPGPLSPSRSTLLTDVTIARVLMCPGEQYLAVCWDPGANVHWVLSCPAAPDWLGSLRQLPGKEGQTCCMNDEGAGFRRLPGAGCGLAVSGCSWVGHNHPPQLQLRPPHPGKPWGWLCPPTWPLLEEGPVSERSPLSGV